jgi:membrane carboxypeptidase/penicillin-binding protein PbpC
MTRLRDVLPQNPNRVRHHDTPEELRDAKDGLNQRAVDTPIKHSVHTHPSSNHQSGMLQRAQMVDTPRRGVGTP